MAKVGSLGGRCFFPSMGLGGGGGDLQGDTLDFDPYLARYYDIVETRGLFYWNPHAILGWKHITYGW